MYLQMNGRLIGLKFLPLIKDKSGISFNTIYLWPIFPAISRHKSFKEFKVIPVMASVCGLRTD